VQQTELIPVETGPNGRMRIGQRDRDGSSLITKDGDNKMYSSLSYSHSKSGRISNASAVSIDRVFLLLLRWERPFSGGNGQLAFSDAIRCACFAQVRDGTADRRRRGGSPSLSIGI
jgi:hypothetical protein